MSKNSDLISKYIRSRSIEENFSSIPERTEKQKKALRRKKTVKILKGVSNILFPGSSSSAGSSTYQTPTTSSQPSIRDRYRADPPPFDPDKWRMGHEAADAYLDLVDGIPGDKDCAHHHDH